MGLLKEGDYPYSSEKLNQLVDLWRTEFNLNKNKAQWDDSVVPEKKETEIKEDLKI